VKGIKGKEIIFEDQWKGRGTLGKKPALGKVWRSPGLG